MSFSFLNAFVAIYLFTSVFAGHPKGSWPGKNKPVTVDAFGDYTENLSGLEYLPPSGDKPAILYGIMNGPANLYRLILDTKTGLWVQDPTWTKSGISNSFIICFITYLNLFFSIIKFCKDNITGLTCISNFDREFPASWKYDRKNAWFHESQYHEKWYCA
jgi:hypothetical protein